MDEVICRQGRVPVPDSTSPEIQDRKSGQAPPPLTGLRSQSPALRQGLAPELPPAAPVPVPVREQTSENRTRVLAAGRYDAGAMGELFERIQAAAEQEAYLVSWHADERCELRGIAVWQVVAGLSAGRLVDERPATRPRPTVVVEELLPDGQSIEAVWSWLAETNRCKLVTVYFKSV